MHEWQTRHVILAILFGLVERLQCRTLSKTMRIVKEQQQTTRDDKKLPTVVFGNVNIRSEVTVTVNPSRENVVFS